ncbi:MAG: family 20 glycosylhydrolase [Oscillospiraceae bacterium]
MRFCFTGVSEKEIEAIKELQIDYSYMLSDDGISVEVEQVEHSAIIVTYHNNSAKITYDKRIHFFRGFGLLIEHLRTGETEICLSETPQFTMNGAMIDVSQGNAVIRPDVMKSMIRRMAFMGLNMLMIYCEDSFEVESQPFFGYMRAKYTQAELYELDEYAELFDIEMIPCIQTLAHLTDVLKWNVYADFKEDESTLLVGNEKTYQFIEDLITTATKPFHTNKIHIGMDEAWKLGRGNYLTQHGLVPTTQIMQEHLKRVKEILDRFELEPIMWSDMFFRALGSGDYYQENLLITQEYADTVPKNIQLVYWDYYPPNQESYEKIIAQHRMFGEPIFAGGIWTWCGFGANWGKTFCTTNPALMACKQMGVKQVFATIWGDNGTESNVMVNLLGLSLFAEHGYCDELDMQKFKNRFEFCAGASYDDFYSLAFLDETPGSELGNLGELNPSKYLMWQDILTGLFDKNIEGLPLNAHYDKLAQDLKLAIQKNSIWNSLFQFYYHVADVLSVKAEIGVNITNAYREGNRAQLKILVNEVLPDLVQKVEVLRKSHKTLWFETYKALGWDIIDMRYGALLIRIRSAKEQIGEYLNGKCACIEELEVNRLPYNGKEGLSGYANFYGKIVSPSRIAPEA